MVKRFGHISRFCYILNEVLPTKTITLVVGSMCSIFHNTRKQFKIQYGIQIRHQVCRGLYRLQLQLYSFVVICCLLQLVNVIRQLQTVLLHFWVLSALIKNDQSNPMVAVSGCFILNQTNYLLKRLVIKKCNTICIVNRILKMIFVLLKINVVKNKMCYIYSSTIIQKGFNELINKPI